MNFFIHHKIYIYITFIVLIINLIQFSTNKANSNIYKISNISVSEPYDLNFDKSNVIDKAFNKAFLQLLKITVHSENLKKVSNFKIKDVKKIIESFEIIEENFKNNEYSSKFNVSFQKKKYLQYLEKKNIFSSIPKNKKIFFLPINVTTEDKKIALYSENFFYKNWNKEIKEFHLIEYILPNEDIEDLILLKKNLENLENYDFKEIINKYDISDYIILITFENDNSINTLTKININKEFVFVRKKYDFYNRDYLKVIKALKKDYEDEWKKINMINTSIKLNVRLNIKSNQYASIKKLEKKLYNIDLLSSFKIEKLSNEKITYKIIYNGTPDKFLNDLKFNNFKVDRSGEIWEVIDNE